jgi:hypothetical protein
MDRHNFLIWNMCGLGSEARRNVVTEMVVQECISILCIHETKLHVIEPSLIESMLGRSFAYKFVPTCGTQGGILVAWCTSVWCGSHIHQSPNVLILKLSYSESPFTWRLMVVYGPHTNRAKVWYHGYHVKWT